MIEIEVRGKIQNFEDVLNRFREKTRFIKEKKRFSLIYFRDKLCEDIREIRNEKVDLRIRVTEGKAELVMKYGTWGSSDSRKEILIPIDLRKFEDMVDFLKCLDWNNGIIMATHTFVFDYKEIEFALVKNKDLNYFEAEKLSENEENFGEIQKDIKDTCKELGLRPFSEEEFIDEINRINNLEENKFDFSKQDFKDIKERFNEFF